MITGAFDASSIPYLLYKTGYQGVGRLSLRAFFWCYMIIPLLLVLLLSAAHPKLTGWRRIIIEQVLIGAKTIYTRPIAPPPTTPSVDGLPPNAIPASEANGGYLPAPVVEEPDPDSSMFSRLHYGPSHGDEDEFLDSRGGEGEGKDPIVGRLYGKTALQQIMSFWFLCVIHSLSHRGIPADRRATGSALASSSST